MKILRDREDPQSKVRKCEYCSSIIEYEDSDINFEYTDWVRGRRTVYKYFICPVCKKKKYLSSTEEESG